MKAYFIYSKQLPSEPLRSINNTLDELGISVILRKQGSDESKTYDFEDARSILKENVKNIKNADIVVAECSYNSSSVGFQVSIAIDEKKPVIALYNLTDNLGHPRHIKSIPITLRGNTSKYMILKQYNSSNINKTLELAIKDAKNLVDTKFILIIPPTIDKYLEWNSKERGIAKAEVTREAIEKMMELDTRYQEFLKDDAE